MVIGIDEWAADPDAASVPIETPTAVSPAVFPVVTVPCVVVTEPTTRAVFASGVSAKSTFVAAVVPAFDTTTV